MILLALAGIILLFVLPAVGGAIDAHHENRSDGWTPS